MAASVLDREVEGIRKSYIHVLDQFDRYRDDKSCANVFYAVDANVVSAMSSPWDNDIDIHLRRLFKTKDSSVNEGFYYVLSEYLLNQERKLLLIPPINNEIEGLWNAAFLEYSEDTVEIQDFIEGVKLLEVESQIDLTERLKNLTESFLGSSRRNLELSRIDKVCSYGQLCNIESFLDDSEHPPLPMPVTDQDKKEVKALFKTWKSRINKKKSPKTQKEHARVAVDANVLSKIEWINKNIEGDSKLVFITNDRKLSEVCDKVSYKGSSFSKLFVRLSYAFLADVDFFNIADVPKFIYTGSKEYSNDSYQNSLEGSEKRFASVSAATWISLMFAENSPYNTYGVWTYKSLYREALKGVRSEWEKYFNGCAQKVRLKPNNLEKEMQYLRDISIEDVSAIKERLPTIQKTLKEFIDRASEQFSIIGLKLRFWSLRPRDKMTQRTIPCVKFSAFEQATQWSDSLRTKGIEHLQESLKTSNWVKSLYQEDPTGYTTCLMFALGFAASNDFKSALALAKSAFILAMGEVENSENSIKGDEAAMLVAMFSRYEADSPLELVSSYVMLDKANSLFFKNTSVLGGSEYKEPRYEIERCTVDLTRRLLQIHNEIVLDKPNTKPDNINYQPVEQVKKIVEIEEFLDAESDVIASYIKERILLDYLQWAMIHINYDGGGREGYFDQAVLMSTFDRLKKNIHSPDTENPSYFSLFVCYCVELSLFSDSNSPSENSILEKKIDDAFDKMKIKDYDETRKLVYSGKVKPKPKK